MTQRSSGKKPFEVIHGGGGTDPPDPPDPLELEKPEGMSPAASKAWDRKIATYRRRGQNISGLEALLARYCELEAIVTESFSSGGCPSERDGLDYAAYAMAFKDTPRSKTPLPQEEISPR